MKILVLNGPNINMLGIREPEVYGRENYARLLDLLEQWAQELDVAIYHYQSNHEGILVDKIQEAYGVVDGIVINPAAYTHTSVAIADAIAAVEIPSAEVHLSDVDSREAFRRISYVTPVCAVRVTGLGFDSYSEAIAQLATYIRTKS